MKRIFALMLIIGIVLCGCDKKEETTDSVAEVESSIVIEESSIVVVEESSEVEEVEESEAVVEDDVIRHPLNGEVLEEVWTGRATAVMINNLIDALPQYGISEADFIYEIETEGGITRLLALFSDFTDVGTIGPVRSSRTFYNSVATSFDAPLIHCGGSGGAIKAQYVDNGEQISNWAHIDQRYNGDYFFRDNDRYDYGGYAWEHTLFTNGEMLLEALEDNGYNTTYEDGADYGLQFAEVVELNGEKAETVVVNFNGGKTTTMSYDAELGKYAAEQYGDIHLDAEIGEGMSYRNVIVVYADQWFRYDGVYNRAYYDIIGSGTGHFACDGEIVPINWSRESVYDEFVYTLEDGTPLILGVGNSYVAVVSTNCPVNFE